MEREVLVDRFGRVHDYLRLSLTDKCNLRCTYCMPENPDFLPEVALMGTDELLQIAEVFVRKFGIQKIRLTGGEPTLHKEFRKIVSQISSWGVKLAITTNGILLDRYLADLKEAGMSSINISLDSLKAETADRITRRNSFTKVMENIRLAEDMGFRIKLNAVIMRGLNDQEVGDFVALTREKDLHVRFIEFMPFDGNRWEWDKVVSAKEMLQSLEGKFEFDKLEDKKESTSRAYALRGGKGSFAFISTVTQPFCEGCNRIRLTADGKIRNCLFSTEELDLLSALREGKALEDLIRQSILSKHKELGGLPDFRDKEKLRQALSSRAMVKIGG